MYAEGKVGPATLADGGISELRLGRTRELVVADAHARFAEAVRRGNVWCATTATGGVAPGTVIGTTAPFTLYNPIGSGKNLELLYAALGYVSGTLGSGTCYYVGSTNPAAAAPTGTAIVPVNALLGTTTGVGKPFTTATLPAAPTVLMPFCTLTPILATSVVAPFQVLEYLDGRFIVPPGCALSFESVAGAGTSPLAVFGACWEEVPV